MAILASCLVLSVSLVTQGLTASLGKAVLDSSAVEIKYQKHYGFSSSPWWYEIGINHGFP